MSDMLGWKSPKSVELLDIKKAAKIWGPAVAYCVPEKMLMIRFLAMNHIAVSHYAQKVSLQDTMYETLSNMLRIDQAPRLRSIDLVELRVTNETHHSQAIVHAPGHTEFHTLFVRILVEGFRLDPNQPYTALLPDYRILVSPFSFGLTCCAHRLAADVTTLASCNLYLHDQFTVSFGIDTALRFSLRITSLSDR
jgi:hypothetical protein